jgi:hypothetical protein
MLATIVITVIAHVTYALRVPYASDATGNKPNGITQLTIRIHVSLVSAIESSSNPLDSTSGFPVSM